MSIKFFHDLKLLLLLFFYYILYIYIYSGSVIIHLKNGCFPLFVIFSLFGHENLLFGFQYIHNISLSTFFLVDCGVVNAGILQLEGVEFMLGGWKFVRITILWFAFLRRSCWKWSHWFSTLNPRYSWMKTDHSLQNV